MFNYLRDLTRTALGLKVPMAAPLSVIKTDDPLDPIQRIHGWREFGQPLMTPRSVGEFPVHVDTEGGWEVVFPDKVAALDSAIPGKQTVAMDDGAGNAPVAAPGLGGAYTIPTSIQNWYMAQSFPGYQALAIMAQQWLVDKACTMPGDDAARHGWELNSIDDEEEFPDDLRQKIKQFDTTNNIKQELSEFNRFNNVFGIRVALFDVRSDDPKYYEKPYNPDGITEGSYKGISQVDPYWMMPMLTAESTSDPSSRHFYEPEYWIISGRKYHRSHLCIIRGPEPADILKPTYIFGGISMVQRIYERVYAAERTANEAPLLSLNKRTTAVHVDMAKALANQQKFEERMAFWIKYRDNHAVKVLGLEETMEQFDTSLSDFDSVIMNQYQLVAAISKVPATKLLGTSPKGFNATGEFEMKSYHEELESIQEHNFTPLLNRHYEILIRSLGHDIAVEVAWNPVDAMTAKELADLHTAQSSAAQNYVNMGAVSPDEVRTKLKDDHRSGFNRLTDEDAATKPGMSPENVAAMEKAGAEKLKGQGALQSGEARATTAEAGAEEDVSGALGASPATSRIHQHVQAIRASLRPSGEAPIAPHVEQDTGPDVSAVVQHLAKALHALNEHGMKEGEQRGKLDPMGRTSTPGTTPTAQPSVAPGSRVVGQTAAHKLPKMKLHGMILAIENPRGTIRSGQNLDGKQWSVTMPHHYGFIKNTMGADGDEMDCFVGPHPASDRVYVVNQNIDGAFDEHKCMMGFADAESAKAAYHAAYHPGWDGFDSMIDCSVDEFKRWLAEGDCNYPMSAEFLARAESKPQTA